MFERFPHYPQGVNPFNKVHVEYLEDWTKLVAQKMLECTWLQSGFFHAYLEKMHTAVTQFRKLEQNMIPTVDRTELRNAIQHVKDSIDESLRHPYIWNREEKKMVYFFHSDASIIHRYIQTDWEELASPR